MHILRGQFQRVQVTDNGPGKLYFIIMVSTAFLIAAMLEALSGSTHQSSIIVSESNHSNGQSRRYCDPPNMTTVYYDFSEETNDDYATSYNQETIVENSISKIDVENYKNQIFINWAFTLSFPIAYFFTFKYGPSNVFFFTLVFAVIIFSINQKFILKFEPELKIIRDIYAAIFGVFLIFSFYQMVFNFASSTRNSLISIASVMPAGLAVGEFLLLSSSVKQNHAFYIIGLISVIWFIIWYKIQLKSPRSRLYYEQQKRMKCEKSRTPWKDVLKSRPIWMTIAVIFGASCGASCILKTMKLYLENIYYLKVETIRAISGLLHVGFSIFCGLFTDYLIKAKIVSITSSRRMIVYLSHFIPAGLLFVIGFVGCNETTPIVLYCLSIMMTGANYTGAFISPLDLAPKYAGPILALCFFFGSFGNLLMDHLTFYILTNQVFVSWRFIFSLNSLILLLTAIFFMLRGSGSVQQWNDPSNKPKEKFNRGVQQGKVVPAAPIPKPRTKSIYMVEKKILKVLHVQEPDKFTRVRAYSTSLPNDRSSANPPNIYRPSNKKRASIS